MMLRNVGVGTLYDSYVMLDGDVSKTYGDDNPATPTLTSNSVTADDFAIAWGSAVDAITAAGTYLLSAADILNISGNSYVDYGDHQLLVNKAALSVTANDASKTYNGLAFTGGNGVSYSGFVNSEDDSVLGGALAYGGDAQNAINAGSYILSVSGLSADNYEISYTDGALTVDKAALSVTANDASKTYDGLAFTGGNGVTYSGFVNSETDSVLGGSLTYGGTAQSAVNAGSYTLTASGLTSGNYDFNYVDGALTVSKAVISAITGLTANNKVYDGTTVATLDSSGAGFTDIIAGDTLTVATAAGAFVDKNAGTDKVVNIFGLSLGGADVGNYTLASTTASTTADIAKAVIAAITGITAADKIYDGTTDATLNTSGAGFTNMIVGDRLTVASGNGVFADASLGTGKSVAITGLSLGGGDAENYDLADTTAVATADITVTPVQSLLPWQTLSADNPPEASAPEIILGQAAGILSGDESLILACEDGAQGQSQCAIQKVTQ
jgi:hypothetical protein